MIPTGGLSSTPQPAQFSERVNSTLQPLIDYEMGGRAINDASAGLQYQLWRVRVDEGVVYLGPDGGNEQPAFIRSGISEIALAFDQNMQPVIAFTQGGQAWLWWFDGTVPGMVFTSIPGAVNPPLPSPRCCRPGTLGRRRVNRGQRQPACASDSAAG